MNIKRTFKIVFIIIVTITVLLALISYSSQWHEDNKVKSTVEKNTDFCGGIENSNLPVRILSDNEKAGNNIMITIRTTKKFHQMRLPILYDTWLTVVNGSNVFLVTDGEDDEYQKKSKKLGKYIFRNTFLN